MCCARSNTNTNRNSNAAVESWFFKFNTPKQYTRNSVVIQISDMRSIACLSFLALTSGAAALPVANDTAEYKFVIIGSGPGGGTLA